MPRSFIAIEFPLDIQNQLLTGISALKNAFPPPAIRWVRAGNIHMTMKFLGEVDLDGLARLAGEVQSHVKGQDPFNLGFSELGLFPERGLPRTLWVGVQPVPGLLTLNSAIETACEISGHALETRPFSPHITIGRISDRFQASRSQDLVAAAGRVDLSGMHPVEVSSVKIFKSDLRPEGPTYSILHSIHFSSTR